MLFLVFFLVDAHGAHAVARAPFFRSLLISMVWWLVTGTQFMAKEKQMLNHSIDLSISRLCKHFMNASLVRSFAHTFAGDSSAL